MVVLWSLAIAMMVFFASGFRPLLTRHSRVSFPMHLNNKKDPSIPDVDGLLWSALNRASSTLANKQRLVDSELNSDPNRASSTMANKQRLVESELNSNPSGSVNQLVNLTISRAQSTISGKDGSSVTGLVHSVIDRAKSTLSQNLTDGSKSPPPTLISLEGKTSPPKPIERYRGNPAIVNTALAHLLWSAILRPNVDSAIDATCGNGFDSLEIAKMLFDPELGDKCQSQLLCIDIQQLACENTTSTLLQEFGPEFVEQHVQVLHTSHAPLPRPNDSSSVGLVVYNLGWLPKSDKDCITKMDSTISSMVDAFLLVRILGMVSVVTYPKTGPQEDVAVRALLECMALLSSRILKWQDYLQELECSDEIKELVQNAMGRVVRLGDPQQTWRVSEHKKLGMDQAPILLTATRIK
jgi:hypothetical protein